MKAIIDAVRYFIHENEDEIARAEAKFVIVTNPIYRNVLLGFVLFIVLAFGQFYINIEHNNYKQITGCIGMFITVFITFMNMLYTKHIFKVALVGTTYGVAKGGVSGLEGGVNLLKQFFALGFQMMSLFIAFFGITAFVNFTWTSAGITVCIALFIGFNSISNKIGG